VFATAQTNQLTIHPFSVSFLWLFSVGLCCQRTSLMLVTAAQGDLQTAKRVDQDQAWNTSN
jgi:hypothetical protein